MPSIVPRVGQRSRWTERPRREEKKWRDRSQWKQSKMRQICGRRTFLFKCSKKWEGRIARSIGRQKKDIGELREYHITLTVIEACGGNKISSHRIFLGGSVSRLLTTMHTRTLATGGDWLEEGYRLRVRSLLDKRYVHRLVIYTRPPTMNCSLPPFPLSDSPRLNTRRLHGFFCNASTHGRVTRLSYSRLDR